MHALSKLLVSFALIATGGLTLATELPEIETFIFHPDQFGKELIPRRQNPQDLIKFISERVNRSTPIDALRQTEKVVDLYDLQELAPYFQSMLDQREAQPDDFLRSILFLRMLARIGLPPEREYARRYFQYLISRATTTESFTELVTAYEALGSGADPAPLAAAIARKVATLDPANPQSVHEAQTLNNLGQLTLPRITAFNQEKDRVSNIPARPARVDREIDLYLGLRPSYPGMAAFAARRLRREVWSEQPPQQIYRADSTRRKQDLAAAFRAAMSRVALADGLPDSARKIMLRACVRAIDFFGGELTESDKKLLPAAGRQFNILSNE
jgi:hypothetical protein